MRFQHALRAARNIIKPAEKASANSGISALRWRSLSTATGGGASSKNDTVYLHVGPSGDFWTGHSIFAAKHLQPDYVKSVALPADMCVEHALDVLDSDDGAWCRTIYDTGIIPEDLMEQLLDHDDTGTTS